MTLNIPQLTEAWAQVDALAHAAVAPIEDDISLKAATEHLEAILSEIGETPGHPLDSLARTLIQRITAYEAQHYPIPDVDGHHMLAYLLEQKPATQKEVAVATGIPQSTISDLMNRKRQFTADHIRRLSAFFKVNPSLFL